LIICPIGTYISKNSSACFADPVTVPVISIYPVQKKGDNNLLWEFSVEGSQLVSILYKTEIRAKWEFEDPILKTIAEPESN